VTAESAIVIALFFSLVTVLVSYIFDEQIVALMGARGDSTKAYTDFYPIGIPLCLCL